MEVAVERLIGIVERSATLTERRSFPFALPRELYAAGKAEAEARLLRWQAQTPRGNPAYFWNRLAWDGIDESNVLPLLAQPHYLASTLPAWALLLEEILAENGSLASRAQPPASPVSWSQAGQPIPFEHALIPFVTIASRRFDAQAQGAADILSTTARDQLLRLLATTLSGFAERTFFADFSAWRLMPERIGTPDPDAPLYSSYIESLRRGALDDLFHAYPVLARLLGECTQQWIDNSVAFVEDARRDRTRLSRELFNGCELGRIERLRTGISDRHNQGRTVFEVVFETRLLSASSAAPTCFYKPRDCRPEQCYNRLLDWLGDGDATQRLATYRTVDCDDHGNSGDHGWVEKVIAAPCEGRLAVERFFERCGSLTAVLYALEASDCTFDNILVAGEQAVLIDAETLLQPRPLIDEGDTWKALSAATEQMFYDSVLRLHLLPRWIARPNGEKIDLSGFGSGTGGRGTIRRKVWEQVNRDAMALRLEIVPVTGNPLRGVTVDGEPVAPEDYLAPLLSGFERTYLQLIARRNELWAEGGPMQGFLSLSSRIIVRNTQTYVGVFDRLLAPSSQRDGADACIALDVLARLFANSDERPLQWPLVAAEVESLLTGNIPRFDAPCSGTSLLYGAEGCIPGYFREPAAEMMRRRFFEMSAADLDLQKRYIRCSFGYFGDMGVHQTVPAAAHSVADAGSEFEAEALNIAQAICSQAIRAGDGSTSWITQSYHVESQFWQVQPIGLFLYDGVCGIALFLSSLTQVLGTSAFDEVIQSTLRVVRDFQSPRMQYHLQREGVGAGLGTASLAYSLARTAIFQKDEALLDWAFEIARGISPAMIASDRRLDLIGGTAGCLLVLDTLAGIRPEPWLLALGIACGERLLEARTEARSGMLAWQTIRGNHLTGLSHGAAGIACALSRLAAWTSDERYLHAAREAEEYERTLYDEASGNWPNLLLPRKEGGYEFWNSWCHGAPGIGLCRLRSVASATEAPQEYFARYPAARLDLERGIASAARMELTGLDTLCCGNLGRIEVLIEAARALGQPQHLARARDIGRAVVERAQQTGNYAAGIRDGIYIPSFHQGMAGVGYQLLRLARPDQLPSVLGWA